MGFSRAAVPLAGQIWHAVLTGAVQCARAQVAQLERQLAGTKEGMEEEMRRLAAEADGLKGQVAALRGAAAPTVAESEASLAALQVRSSGAALLSGALFLADFAHASLTLSRQCQPGGCLGRGWSVQDPVQQGGLHM